MWCGHRPSTCRHVNRSVSAARHNQPEVGARSWKMWRWVDVVGKPHVYTAVVRKWMWNGHSTWESTWLWLRGLQGAVIPPLIEEGLFVDRAYQISLIERCSTPLWGCGLTNGLTTVLGLMSALLGCGFWELRAFRWKQRGGNEMAMRFSEVLIL